VHATHQGTLIGTVAYMSPEQVRGQIVDKRVDVWAFGCVVYEMLTGRAPLVRDTMSDTIAAILEHQPNWTQLPKTAPPAMTRLLERCLAKSPRQRLRDLGDARLEIADILATPAASTRAATDAAPVGRSLLWAAALLGIAIVGSAAVWQLPQEHQACGRPGISSGIQPPTGRHRCRRRRLALSPDRRRLRKSLAGATVSRFTSTTSISSRASRCPALKASTPFSRRTGIARFFAGGIKRCTGHR
jgi:hypothetical protein